ncbi:hypothetical protein NKH77_34475 [Streptomyces sp. M19]
MRAAVALAVLLAVAGYVVARPLTGGGGPPRCLVDADGTHLSLAPNRPETPRPSWRWRPPGGCRSAR